MEWQFEHFKTFTPYEIMQQAAASLLIFEGQNTDGSNPKMTNLINELSVNTGHPSWMPARDTGNIRVNKEGSVFRNKARLFSSFYICVPPNLLKSEGIPKEVMLTDFGRALGSGKINKEKFYTYIVKKFEYPHLSFSDYQDWVDLGVRIRPLILIIKTLVMLFEKHGLAHSYLTSTEIYKHLQPLMDEDSTEAVKDIIDYRKKVLDNLPTDTVRKINEMLSFLSIAGYLVVDSTDRNNIKYWLNLVSRHPNEKTLYFLERSASGAGTGVKKVKVNIIEQYKKLWED